jgi:hypothetical protein
MHDAKGIPAARACADRADVTMLAGNDDIHTGIGTTRERQAGYLRKVFDVSLPLALVIAEHAFGPGRRS